MTMNQIIEQGVAKGLIAFDADQKNITYKVQNKRFRLSDSSRPSCSLLCKVAPAIGSWKPGC
jgi:hypothetical protein